MFAQKFKKWKIVDFTKQAGAGIFLQSANKWKLIQVALQMSEAMDVDAV